MAKKMTFALAFCNRGFMPGELIYGAREDMIKAVTDAGYDYIAMDASLTRFGGIETRDEGLLYAKWLKQHEGEYDGVIFSMPIFADENGAITALQDAGVPILMQAYPDEIGKMDFQHRRDAFCGKFSVTDVFTQYGVPFTVLKPHVVHPLSPKFQENLRDFAAICRVVNGMKRFNLGCIGARTTAFKTTRFDEIAMQKHGINVESFDLSELFFKVQNMADDDPKVVAKKEHLENLIDLAKGLKLRGVRHLKFDAFDTRKIDEYAAQAKAAWGTTPAYKEFEQKSKCRTREDDQNIVQGLMDIFAEFGAIKGADPASAEAQALVKKLQEYITQHFYNCTNEILSGLGKMYAGGGDFTKNIDSYGGEGTAEFVHQAIEV